MEDRAVVTCFLRHGPEVLLCRRSDAVGTYPGLWGAVSGFAQGTPDEAARWAIQEVVGLLGAATVVRSADPIPIEDEALDARWLVHPYLFDCESTDDDPGEAVAESEWVQPPAILDRETVPGLWAAYAAVAPTVETVREDDDHGSAYVSIRALEVLRDRAAAIAAGVPGPGQGDHAGRDGAADLASLARDLRSARPSMGVLGNRINRVMTEAAREPRSIRDASIGACERAVRADGEAAAAVAEVVGDRVLTLSRSGTVLEALREADPSAVFVAESRPAREGVGVAEALATDDGAATDDEAATDEEVSTDDGAAMDDDTAPDVSLCVDAAVGHVVATEAVDTVLVGADAVLADGAVVNKVGTRLAALAARDAGIDCYAVCSRDKVVPERSIELETGPREAVYERSAPFGVLNPTFERTPPGLFTGVVTESDVRSTDDVAVIADEHADLADWGE